MPKIHTTHRIFFIHLKKGSDYILLKLSPFDAFQIKVHYNLLIYIIAYNVYPILQNLNFLPFKESSQQVQKQQTILIKKNSSI